MQAEQQGLEAQVGTIPFRHGETDREVLLITTRGTRRWVIPKGWPIPGMKPHRAAEQEAFEEAGVRGSVAKKAFGSYLYWKRLERTFILCHVAVFPLEVDTIEPTWLEADKRERHWFSLEDASLLVAEPGLAALLTRFNASAPLGKRKLSA